MASGNDPLEATSHAICELVERDAMTLFQFESPEAKRARRVALDSVDDAACRAVLERDSRADVQVAVWNVTSDVGIPAFVCTILDRESGQWRALGPASGSGAHPCREIALSRALTEAAQVRLTVIAGNMGPQSATLTLDIDGTQQTVQSAGNGPVDATFNAIKLLVPHDAKLDLYQVHAVTEGTDAQAEVSVRLEEGGRMVTGRGADTDTMVASARAYVSALNKLLVKRQKTARVQQQAL